MENENLLRASSLTHEHILSVINTELKSRPDQGSFRLLDVGCGNGIMLSYLYRSLKHLWPEKEFEVYGFDVGDHETQAKGFFDKGLERIKTEIPNYPWADRMHLITQDQKWPFEDHFFDIIVSNQVLEHIFTPDHFFSELRRCLKDDGFSTHLAPVWECVYDGHVYMPWAHRFENKDNLEKFMYVFGLMGFGSYWHFKKRDNQKFSTQKLKEWCTRNSKYVIESCSYMKINELTSYSQKHGFDLNFDHTMRYYERKFNQIMGRKRQFEYPEESSSIEKIGFPFLKKISSITVNLKPQ